MTLFSVFTREGTEPADRLPRLVAERFLWSAALFAPIFMLFHRLWLAFLVYVLVVVALAFASLWIGANATFWLYWLAAILFGFEAPSVLRRALKRRGYVHVAERFAADRDLAATEWLLRTDAGK